MEVIRLPKKVNIKGLTLCVGNFDGLHLGHQKLINEAKTLAGKHLGVFLFDRNPAEFLKTSKSRHILTSFDDKLEILSSLGVDYVFVLPVSENFLSLSKEEFIKIYIEPLKPELIVCGTDYRFGHKALGTPEHLSLSHKVHLVDLLSINGEKVSTQGIIKLIQDGHIEEANILLGRPYRINGKVVKGLQNGTKIGYPTANVKLLDNYVLPQNGVYAGSTNGLVSMINVGTNPTIGVLKEPLIESHIVDFNGDLYNQNVSVSFSKFIREEKTFASLSELKSQLDQDLAKVIE